jgi:hypothetical protein
MGVYKSSLISENETLAYFQYNRELYKNYVESEDSDNEDDEDGFWLKDENTAIRSSQ